MGKMRDVEDIAAGNRLAITKVPDGHFEPRIREKETCKTE